MMQRTLLVILLLLPAIGGKLQAAETAELWPRWSVHDAQNPARIDHRDWP